MTCIIHFLPFIILYNSTYMEFLHNLSRNSNHSPYNTNSTYTLSIPCIQNPISMNILSCCPCEVLLLPYHSFSAFHHRTSPLRFPIVNDSLPIRFTHPHTCIYPPPPPSATWSPPKPLARYKLLSSH
jgi:hypothetical protein